MKTFFYLTALLFLPVTATPGNNNLFPGCDDISKNRYLSFSGCNFHRARLDGLNRPFVDLSRTDLAGATLRSVIIPFATLAGARLQFTDFSDADLTGTDFSRTSTTNANFKNARLDFAFWSNGKICAPNSIEKCKSFAPTGDEKRDVIQTLLHHPDLRNLRGWSDQNPLTPLPLVLGTNKQLRGTEPFVFYTTFTEMKPVEELKKSHKDGNFLYFTHISIRDKFANVTYKYPEFGMEGNMSLYKNRDGFWEISANSTSYAMPYHNPAEKIKFLAMKNSTKQQELDTKEIRAKVILTDKSIQTLVQAILDHEDFQEDSMFHLDARSLNSLTILSNTIIKPDFSIKYRGKPARIISEKKALKMRFTHFFEITSIETFEKKMKVSYGFPSEAKFGWLFMFNRAGKWHIERNVEMKSSSGRRSRLEKFYLAMEQDNRRKEQSIISENGTTLGACNNDDADSCYRLGNRFQKAGLYEQTKLYLAKACKLNHNRACHNYASTILQSRASTFEEFTKATELLEKLCQKGIEKSCRNLEKVRQRYKVQ